MRVVILYNVTSAWDRADVEGVLQGVISVRDTLQALGHEPVPISLNDSAPPLVEELVRLAPDLVFNLCEGFGEFSAGEYWVAGLLELLGLSYTGSAPAALAMALDKSVAKRLFIAAGIPTPDFVVYTAVPVAPPALRFPLILKLAGEDASVGISRENVVHDEPSFFHRLHQLLAEYSSPVLAEQFIDGREFTLAMLDGHPLVLEEIEFDVEPRILCYGAKWDSGSAEDLGTRAVFTPIVNDRQREQIFELARRVWDLIGMRDYGRVDFRMDAEGRLFVLEANPNPDITPGSGYRLALESAQIPFTDFVARVVDNAARRRRRAASTSTEATGRTDAVPRR